MDFQDSINNSDFEDDINILDEFANKLEAGFIGNASSSASSLNKDEDDDIARAIEMTSLDQSTPSGSESGPASANPVPIPNRAKMEKGEVKGL